jgi:hypothetical protein
LGYVIGFLALLLYLTAMYQREAVKRDLKEHGFEPLHIWWRPAAYWTTRFPYWGATGFRVVYSDAEGCIHKAYCFAYRSFAQDSRWGARRVRWLTDAV